MEPERLARMLDRLAADREAMSIVEMVGFVTVLALQPRRMPTSEWIPIVCGQERESDTTEPVAEMKAALIRHFNGLACTLASEPECYAPVLEVDEHTHEVLWKPWIIGFARAMRLRTGAWVRIKDRTEVNVQEAVQVVRTLFAAANGTSELGQEALDLLDSMAPMLIVGLVRDLHESKNSRREGATGQPEQARELGPGYPSRSGRTVH